MSNMFRLCNVCVLHGLLPLKLVEAQDDLNVQIMYNLAKPLKLPTETE